MILLSHAPPFPTSPGAWCTAASLHPIRQRNMARFFTKAVCLSVFRLGRRGVR